MLTLEDVEFLPCFRERKKNMGEIWSVIFHYIMVKISNPDILDQQPFLYSRVCHQDKSSLVHGYYILSSNKTIYLVKIHHVTKKFSNALADHFKAFSKKFQLGTSLGQPK